MTFKKIAFFCIASILGISSALAADWSQLLLKAEQNTQFYETDFSANYSIVQEKPGSGKSVTEAIMYRRDKTGKWTILITGPAKEKGKGYLQSDGTIWFFDPADRRFTFTSAGDKFQNTNAVNSDFAPQPYYSSYSIVSAEEVKLGTLDCVLFTLKAKTKDVSFPGLKIWVTKDDGFVRMKEDYSATGQKLRTTAVSAYQTVGGKHSVPVSMIIRDEVKGKKVDGKMQYERTQITIKNPSFAKVGDNVYTKPYLEMMSPR